MQRHYLQYLTDVMSHQWNDAALTDYGENHEYTFGSLAVEMIKLQILFEQLGIQWGGLLGQLGTATIGAVAILWVASLIKK